MLEHACWTSNRKELCDKRHVDEFCEERHVPKADSQDEQVLHSEEPGAEYADVGHGMHTELAAKEKDPCTHKNKKNKYINNKMN